MRVEDDAWDPFSDPDGNEATRGIADRLKPIEWKVLLAAAAGARLREVEEDRLVTLGLALRDKEGELHLTKLAHETLKAAPQAQSGA